jgi:glutamate dehydrogenase/leucine dehydrogenase
VSCFEWVQNIENEQWSLDQVNQRLRKNFEKALDEVAEAQRELNAKVSLQGPPPEESEDAPPPLEPANMRTAAYVLAISRVANVAIERGIWSLIPHSAPASHSGQGDEDAGVEEQGSERLDP